jgi:hypothetical protein
MAANQQGGTFLPQLSLVYAHVLLSAQAKNPPQQSLLSTVSAAR